MDKLISQINAKGNILSVSLDCRCQPTVLRQGEVLWHFLNFQETFYPKFWIFYYALYILISPSAQNSEKSVSSRRQFLPFLPLGWPWLIKAILILWWLNVVEKFINHELSQEKLSLIFKIYSEFYINSQNTRCLFHKTSSV